MFSPWLDSFTDSDTTSHTTNLHCPDDSKSPIPRTTSGDPVTSLRNRYHFPSAANLPHENDVVIGYYQLDPINDSFRRKKHWAYLGEITSMHKMRRLCLTTRDMAGNDVPVWFYLDHEENARRMSMFRTFTPDFSVAKTGKAVEDGVEMGVGRTIVVVYPELHNFADGNCGLRIEEKVSFKALPYSLNELLTANDTIVNQKLPSFTPQCYHCNADGNGKLQRCGRCGIAYYCSKDCQTADWGSNGGSATAGHKSMCKLYREVKWFTEMDWDSHNPRQPISFCR